MNLAVVGLNHRGAPVEVRERVAFGEPALPGALESLRRATGADEAVILSTCNRVELYTAASGDADPRAATVRWLSEFHRVPEDLIAPAIYLHGGVDAVRHLYRVASGLDAMVVGETQILAQVKEAYQAAAAAGATGRVFNTVFQRALRVAKHIHATTGVGRGQVSAASIAARLAGKVFQDLAGKRLVVAGAGETAELTLAAFRDRGATRPVIVNRSASPAERLAAATGGRAAPAERLAAEISAADVVITCLGGSDFAVDAAMVAEAQRVRRGEPLVILDLGVPRNVHPGVNALDNVYLFNIDDLERIAAQGLADREREIARALPEVDSEARETLLELGEDEYNGLMLRLRDRLCEIGEEEIARTLDRIGLAPEARQEVEFMVRRILNKILHEPTLTLKKATRGGPAESAFLEAVARLFNIR